MIDPVTEIQARSKNWKRVIKAYGKREQTKAVCLTICFTVVGFGLLFLLGFAIHQSCKKTPRWTDETDTIHNPSYNNNNHTVSFSPPLPPPRPPPRHSSLSPYPLPPFSPPQSPNSNDMEMELWQPITSLETHLNRQVCQLDDDDSVFLCFDSDEQWNQDDSGYCLPVTSQVRFC